MVTPTSVKSRVLTTLLAVGALTLTPLSGSIASGAPAETSGADAPNAVTQPDRPASVPEEYVLTPNGYFSPECVHTVGEDQVVVPKESGSTVVTLPSESGATSSHDVKGDDPQISSALVDRSPHVDACTSPRFDREGGEQTPATPADDAATIEADETLATNGWIYAANTGELGPMSRLKTTWNVPPPPADPDGQALYFFPGFQTSNDVETTIMQPVLQWFSGEWILESWNCCSQGDTWASPIIPVTGDTITGEMAGSDCDASTGVCETWAITSIDDGSGESTTLTTKADGKARDSVFGGALEAYNLESCDQLPGEPVTFSSIVLEDINGTKQTPEWEYETDFAGLSPQCDYEVTIGDDQSVTFGYN